MKSPPDADRPPANHGSGWVEELAQSFADDLAGSGVIGFGPGFCRRLQLRIDAYRHNHRRTRAHRGTAAPASLERLNVILCRFDALGDGIKLAVGNGPRRASARAAAQSARRRRADAPPARQARRRLRGRRAPPPRTGPQWPAPSGDRRHSLRSRRAAGCLLRTSGPPTPSAPATHRDDPSVSGRTR